MTQASSCPSSVALALRISPSGPQVEPFSATTSNANFVTSPLVLIRRSPWAPSYFPAAISPAGASVAARQASATTNADTAVRMRSARAAYGRPCGAHLRPAREDPGADAGGVDACFGEQLLAASVFEEAVGQPEV